MNERTMRHMRTRSRRKIRSIPEGPANVRFEVFHNGRRVARAGIPGFAVLNTHVTWVRRDLSRFPPRTKVEHEEMYMHLGGLDSNDPAADRSIRWKVPKLRIGDRLEIRISDNSRVDPPGEVRRFRERRKAGPGTSRYGVLASAEQEGPRNVRVLFQDVPLERAQEGASSYTHRNLVLRSFRLSKLPARELQAIGLAVIARLAAFDQNSRNGRADAASGSARKVRKTGRGK